MKALDISEPVPADRSFAAAAICFVFLMLAVLLFHGKTVPFSNEFLYLLRLQPGFLPNDWTFSSPANEHWLFNFIFSIPAHFVSIEVVGWMGRIASWALMLWGIITLARHWSIAYWKIAASVFVWLAFAQAVVGDEWMFGGFEAKSVAYACLLFSLAGFCRRQIIVPSILLGLTFSFHPAVGLWAIPAVGAALLFEKLPAIDLVKVVVITSVFTLLGAMPLLIEQTGASAGTPDDWKFITLYRLPWHLDVFQFSKGTAALVFVMLAFNIAVLWKSESFALRFLLKFQIVLGLFFVGGIAFRYFEMYSLLRFMPLRLFPLFTPLFFIFTAFYLIGRLSLRQHKILAVIFTILVVAFLNPASKGYFQIRETFETWTKAPDDLQTASVWIAQNTPPDALVIQPPHRRDLWYFSKRAAIVSYGYPPYDRLGEWRTRVSDLTGGLQILKADTAIDEIESAYARLSFAEVENIKTKYAATHLVSRAVYSYPIVFETGTYKVYKLP